MSKTDVDGKTLVDGKTDVFKTDGKTTIVTAFMANINKREDRSYKKYVDLASKLLSVNIPKVVFVDSTVYHEFKQFSNDFTILVPFYKESNYLYEIRDQIDVSCLSTTNPGKDTAEYMMTMAYKTEFVKKAIQLDLFGSEQYIWIDIGIRHMTTCSDEEFTQKIMRLQEAEYTLDHVRIPSIWNPDVDLPADIYTRLYWYFAGSMFGGNKKALLWFADETRRVSLKIIEERKSLPWEINVWHIIYVADRWKFCFYTCSHDNSILDLY
jgi:hypothetical protein